MRTLYPAALAVLALALSGCLSDSDDPDSTPNPPVTGVPDLPPADTTFVAQFDPLKGIMPYPNDILGFLANPSADGTLNVPELATWPLAPVVNQLDGFSTNARIQANFTRGVDPASLGPGSVFLLEVALSKTTKATVGLSDVTLCKLNLVPPPANAACPGLGVPAPTGNPFLIPGVDYVAELAPDFDAGGQTIQLRLLKSLNGNRDNLFTPGTENGYLVIMTNAITDERGMPASPDATYAQIRAGYQAGVIQLPPPGTPLPPDLTTEQLLALFVAAHLEVAKTLGIPTGNIVATASFTTLDTTVVLESAVSATEPLPAQFAPYTTPIPLPDGYTWDQISYVIGGYKWKSRYMDENGYIITQGITDDLITDLSGYAGIEVITSRIAFQYANSDLDLKALANELLFGDLVHGGRASVSTADDGLNIVCEAIGDKQEKARADI